MLYINIIHTHTQKYTCSQNVNTVHRIIFTSFFPLWCSVVIVNFASKRNARLNAFYTRTRLSEECVHHVSWLYYADRAEKKTPHSQRKCMHEHTHALTLQRRGVKDADGKSLLFQWITVPASLWMLTQVLYACVVM